MKCLIKIAATVLGAAQLGRFPAFAQPATTTAAKHDGPHIKFAEESFDFGRVSSSDVLRHDFIVTNTGGTPLEISSVKPACGCTTAGAWDRFIPAGQSGKIPIQFNPAGFAGPVAKSLR